MRTTFARTILMLQVMMVGAFVAACKPRTESNLKETLPGSSCRLLDRKFSSKSFWYAGTDEDGSRINVESASNFRFIFDLNGKREGPLFKESLIGFPEAKANFLGPELVYHGFASRLTRYDKVNFVKSQLDIAAGSYDSQDVFWQSADPNGKFAVANLRGDERVYLFNLSEDHAKILYRINEPGWFEFSRNEPKTFVSVRVLKRLIDVRQYLSSSSKPIKQFSLDLEKLGVPSIGNFQKMYLSFTQDDKFLVIGKEDGHHPIILDLETGKSSYLGPYKVLQVSPYSNRVFLERDDNLSIYDFSDKKLLKLYGLHNKESWFYWLLETRDRSVWFNDSPGYSNLKRILNPGGPEEKLVSYRLADFDDLTNPQLTLKQSQVLDTEYPELFTAEESTKRRRIRDQIVVPENMITFTQKLIGSADKEIWAGIFGVGSNPSFVKGEVLAVFDRELNLKYQFELDYGSYLTSLQAVSTNGRWLVLYRYYRNSEKPREYLLFDVREKTFRSLQVERESSNNLFFVDEDNQKISAYGLESHAEDGGYTWTHRLKVASLRELEFWDEDLTKANAMSNATPKLHFSTRADYVPQLVNVSDASFWVQFDGEGAFRLGDGAYLPASWGRFVGPDYRYWLYRRKDSANVVVRDMEIEKDIAVLPESLLYLRR